MGLVLLFDSNGWIWKCIRFCTCLIWLFFSVYVCINKIERCLFSTLITTFYRLEKRSSFEGSTLTASAQILLRCRFGPYCWDADILR